MSCYLQCGGEGYRIRQQGVRDNPDIDVLECAECGLVYLSYRESSITEHRMIRDLSKWAAHTLPEDQIRAKRIDAKGKSILDFGCGNGNFLANVDADVKRGVEIDEEARQYCLNRGLTVFDDIEQLRKLDIITMFHVIEHIPDPIALLKKLGNHLNKNGRIIIETPNANDVLLTFYNCKEFAEFTYWSKHPFLYNGNTIVRLAERAGFKVTVKQHQRYPLSNHLYWLAEGKPNGHEAWREIKDSSYQKSLARLGMCDTIIATLEKQA